MPIVRIGHDDGQITEAMLWTEEEGWSDQERFHAVAANDELHRGIWETHRTVSGSAFPAWIESDDHDLATRIAAHFRCPVGRPTSDKEVPQL